MKQVDLLDRTSDLKAILDQDRIPVLYRAGSKGTKLRVRLPYAVTNRAWLQSFGRRNPVWLSERKIWEVPKSWFDDMVEAALKKYGRLYVIQPYREEERCSPQCLNAVGHECQCSCMGANHGQGNDGSWFEVSETFATRWGERTLACRLLSI